MKFIMSTISDEFIGNHFMSNIIYRINFRAMFIQKHSGFFFSFLQKHVVIIFFACKIIWALYY